MGGVEFELRPQDPEAARELGRQCGVGTATAQVLLHRGLDDAGRARDFLSPRLSGLTPPEGMADRDLAADRLARAVRSRERVAVFGDYDVDGTTSAAILADVLEALGGEVTALVANRFDGGYGFSDAALARCREAGAQLIVTCDCGSSDHARIEAARAAGVDVIVVDHHLVPDEPLPALAFLNPNRPDCGFPYKGLASAGLALSVGAAVRRELGADLDLRTWLDLVALGTVADVAPLDGDNRCLVRAGLARISSSQARPGVAALREVARVGGTVGAVDIAFRLAPRLNAPGRLGDATPTLELLRARSPEQARGLAARIEQLNQTRRELERAVTDSAVREVLEVYGEEPVHGVVVAAEGWHPGVVGITAARIKERFGVPAVVVALEGDEGRGSARGPAGFALYDALSACASELVVFGGHQAAAGMTLRRARLEAFRAAFADASACPPEGWRGAGRPPVDALLDGTVYPVPPAADLLSLEPVGQANAEPLFAVRGARVEQVRAVGAGAHLAMNVRIGPQRLRAFGYDLGARAPELGESVDLLAHVRVDNYRGAEKVELRIVALG